MMTKSSFKININSHAMIYIKIFNLNKHLQYKLLKTINNKNFLKSL